MRKISFKGKSLWINANFEPAQHGGMTDPSWGAYYEIINIVWENHAGVLLEITDFVEYYLPEMIDQISDALMEDDKEY